MSVVAVVIPMEPTYLAYERPPDASTLWSAIPRGLRGFVVGTGILAAKPLNDTETLSLTGTLPANFAYIFSDISLRLSQDKAYKWGAEYTLSLQSYYQGMTAVISNWNFDFAREEDRTTAGTRGGGAQAGYSYPKNIIWAPRGSSGILINIHNANLNSEEALAGTVSCYINFWEFDLEQARKFPLNSPFPVHSR